MAQLCFRFDCFILVQLTILLRVTMKALRSKSKVFLKSFSKQFSISLQVHYIFLQELLVYNWNQLEPFCITDFHFWRARIYSENGGFESIEIIFECACEDLD